MPRVPLLSGSRVVVVRARDEDVLIQPPPPPEQVVDVGAAVRDVDEPARYLSFAPWESFEAQAAWKADPEFGERIGRVRQHTDEFTPSVFELVTQVG